MLLLALAVCARAAVLYEPLVGDPIPVSLRLTNGLAVVRAAGTEGFLCSIESSSDLKHWTTVYRTAFPESGAVEAVFRQEPCRFYRASQAYP
jgi:hypothetical protein